MTELTYARDHGQRLITVVTRGALTVDDILTYIDRHVTEGTWGYALMYEIVDAVRLLSERDIERITRRVHLLTAALGPCGPVAFVSPAATTGGVERQYAAALQDVSRVALFQDRAAAERWLNREAAHTNRLPYRLHTDVPLFSCVN
jgi:hypothetical protein